MICIFTFFSNATCIRNARCIPQTYICIYVCGIHLQSIADLCHGYCVNFMVSLVVIFNRGKINQNFLSFLFFNFSWCSKENNTTATLKHILSPRKLSSSLTIALPIIVAHVQFTAQKVKYSVKDFFSNCDQIRRKLQTWSHLLKKSLKENFIFCVQ